MKETNKNTNIHSALHSINFDPTARRSMLLSLTLANQAQALLHTPKHVLHDLLKQLKDEELLAILEFLDPDEATDVIQRLPKRKQEEVLGMLTKELRDSVEILNKFDPQTAAGLMNIDYIQVETTDTVTEVVKKIKKHEKRTGRVPVIIAMKNGKLHGFIPGYRLGLAAQEDNVSQHVKTLPTVHHDANYDEVIDLFTDHPHNKVAVLGAKNSVLGIIYSDDVLRILQEKESSSLYNFAGLDPEESVTDSAMKKVHSRYRWLIINLGTAFLAAATVGLFEDTISKYVLLAVYMPIVAGMGGNAATQTLAVIVRGIALKQIELKTAWKTLKREVGAGIIHGFINGFIVAGVVIVFNKDVKLAIVLAMAMVINLLVASFFGTIIPLVMKRIGKDPATSATIFITTATDVLGFLAFLGLATVIL